jgi:PAS domain S-box-containing protein
MSVKGMNVKLGLAAVTLAALGIGKVASSRVAFGNGQSLKSDHHSKPPDGNDWLRLVYESVEDYAIFEVDSQGKIASWNKGAQNLLGYSADEILGRECEVFYPPEERGNRVPEKEMNCAMREQRAGEGRWLVRKDGSRFFATEVSKSLKDDARNHQGFVKIIRDITERKAMEEQLKAREAHSHQLADAMPQIAFTAEPDGHVDYFNQKWFDYSGFSEEQTYAPDGWAPILHPEDQNTIGRWYEIVRKGEPFSAEERYKDRRTGAYRWFLRRALPVKNEAGQVIRWFGTATDITEQKETQLALAQTREELRIYANGLEAQVAERTEKLTATVQSMEEIVYHVAHDLRAPLRAMHGFTSILLRQCSPMLNQEPAEFGKLIQEAATRMDALIQDLLTYGRLSQTKVVCEEIRLGEEVHTALRILEPQIQATGAQVSIDEPLPTVVASRTLLGEIIINLMGNALKFTAPGVSPVIHIWAEEHDGMVRLLVQDNGIGIDPQYQEKIFGMFQRLHEREAYPGTGIGLAIVVKGVERMGGRVGVDSTPGGGSRFWFELPKAGH